MSMEIPINHLRIIATAMRETEIVEFNSFTNVCIMKGDLHFPSLAEVALESLTQFGAWYSCRSVCLHNTHVTS